MTALITPSRIRKNNRTMIYQLIYQEKSVTQLDIAYMLHLSRPNVAGKLNELLESGLIVQSGLVSSDQIGRRAVSYSIASEYRIAVGVHITELSVYMMAVNLYGEEIAFSVYSAEFSDTDAYYDKVCRFLEEFIHSVTTDKAAVLGIGIALDALPSADGLQIVPGGPMKDLALSASVFSDRLGIPCRFIREAGCAAVTEIWTNPELENCFYLYLSYHLDGAVIYGRSVFSGKHGRSGEIAHIPYKENGNLCYCGKRGCLETVISATALLGPKEGMTEFFHELRKEEPGHVERWNEYLSGLAFAIAPLAPVFDCDFILGGETAAFITEEDLKKLHELIRDNHKCGLPEDSLHIHPILPRGIPLGAALPFIWTFLAEFPDK